MLQQKSLMLTEMKLADAGSGSVEGYASTFGNVDSYGDTIMPGAYRDTIADFLKNGFLGWSHDWANPIGTIRTAYEDAKGLYVVADFHSDDESQKYRRRTMERLERGASMGMSIGYEAKEWEFRAADTPMAGDMGRIRMLKQIKLFENSLVTVPADAFAGVTGSKAGLRLVDHEALVRAQVSDVIARYRSLASDAEGKIGAAISRARRERLTGLSGMLRSGADDLDALLTETEPKSEEDGKALRAMIRRAVEVGARARRELMTGSVA